MFYCYACGSNDSHEEFVDEIFQIERIPILMERIPALVCDRCEEAVFSRGTTEKVRRMAHGEKVLVRSVSMEVFQFVS
ncbi:MAG: YgiT-type zinc finger protein [Candidatus Omnitrophota bacterium]|jgi:YgiT-type zinc finger domain-containing protein|nr:MAG: YgiT-type zinc finger protein [Candidatus Omnitrophota bacterium]